ncbi:MAG: hypothetical protein MJ000_00430 [Bacteroidales bacterium]|nr:hypothetical protein [Bacteroidales bacterium]
MRFRKMRDIIASAALLLALAVPSAAYGQTTTDNFFNVNDDGHRGGSTGGTGSWLGFGENTGGEATWSGFEDGGETPLGGGLLVLALSGVCYGAAKVKRGARRD